MNTGQMMITMAAMILLSTVILSVNKNALTNSSSMAKNKYQIMAVSLGTALLEEAFGKSFDATTAINPFTGEADRANKLNDLTNYNSLGPNNLERLRREFNDFDDYNGYVDSAISASIDSTASLLQQKNGLIRSGDISEIFKIQSKVYYVDPSASVNLNKVTYRTWHKRMDVFITSCAAYNFLDLDTVKLSKVYSYYYF